MMKLLRCCLVVAVLAAGCAHPPSPPPSADPGRPPQITPANIKRVAADLPPGSEIGTVAGVTSAPAVWGLARGWTANPPYCAALADPLAGHPGPAQGVSGSGPGGISYAVVQASTTGPVAPDPGGVSGCPHWTMSQGRTTARVHLIDPPRIGGADTLGMACEITTVVEGGTEIVSHADTFAAYLGDYYAFAAVADPGGPHPASDARVAADLLIKTVSALRGERPPG